MATKVSSKDLEAEEENIKALAQAEKPDDEEEEEEDDESEVIMNFIKAAILTCSIVIFITSIFTLMILICDPAYEIQHSRISAC